MAAVAPQQMVFRYPTISQVHLPMALPSQVPSPMVLTSPVLTLPILSSSTNFIVDNSGDITNSGTIHQPGISQQVVTLLLMAGHSPPLHTTANLFNSTVTNLSIGGTATTLALGASTGTATINNATLSLPNALVGIGVSPISAL